MDEIIPFQPELARHFKDLNLEWLEEFFYVEDHDLELLNDCQKNIIEPGGHIFFYKRDTEIIGCFALIPVDESIIELAKMAVKESARGQGIGQKLLSFCLEFSKQNQWNKLILYSNRSLENTIHIYRKYGFREIEMDKSNPYARGDIKMELNLS